MSEHDTNVGPEPARALVVVACAASAGIHGALVPEHLAEGAGAGVGFAVATALLAGLAVWIARGTRAVELVAASVVLAGLLASYGLTATTGIPVLHPEAEPVTALAVATKAIEAVGLVAAAYVLVAPAPLAFSFPRPKGTST